MSLYVPLHDRMVELVERFVTGQLEVLREFVEGTERILRERLAEL